MIASVYVHLLLLRFTVSSLRHPATFVWAAAFVQGQDTCRKLGLLRAWFYAHSNFIVRRVGIHPMGFTAVIIGVVIALVAVIGIRPRGGKPVGNTQMMTVARVVLVVIALVVLFFAFRR
jgi:hypothetical protein